MNEERKVVPLAKAEKKKEPVDVVALCELILDLNPLNDPIPAPVEPVPAKDEDINESNDDNVRCSVTSDASWYLK